MRGIIINIIIVISAIFFGYFFVNHTSFTGKESKIEVINGKVKKFGILGVGDEASHYFRIKNVGTGDLKILNVATKCGCTVPTWNESAIPPGVEDSIKVIYDTNIIGPFNQSIELYTNSPSEKEVLHILGIVKE